MSKKFKEMGPEDLIRQPADDGELFVAGTSYEVGAFVVYNGRLYVCKQATDGTKVPTDTDYWNDMTNVSARFTNANTSLTDMLPYGYASDNLWDGTATDGSVNRMAQVTANVAITAPKPTSGKSGDFILRFSVSAESAPTVTVNPPTDCVFTSPLYAISGDTIGTSGEYEMMIQLIPTATENTYDYIECVRKISE